MRSRVWRGAAVAFAWKLPIEHPEGIAFDGDTLYVVSDSEERLYTFELDRARRREQAQIAAAGAGADRIGVGVR